MTAMIVAAAALAAVAILCLAASRAWRGWLELKRLELVGQTAPNSAGPQHDTAVRIELAAMRERLRRLEQIASGVDP